jgi:hypothetical protein
VDGWISFLRSCSLFSTSRDGERISGREEWLFLTFSSFVVSKGWSGGELMADGSAPSPFQQRHRGDTQAIEVMS